MRRWRRRRLRWRRELEGRVLYRPLGCGCSSNVCSPVITVPLQLCRYVLIIAYAKSCDRWIRIVCTRDGEEQGETRGMELNIAWAPSSIDSLCTRCNCTRILRPSLPSPLFATLRRSSPTVAAAINARDSVERDTELCPAVLASLCRLAQSKLCLSPGVHSHYHLCRPDLHSPALAVPGDELGPGGCHRRRRSGRRRARACSRHRMGVVGEVHQA